MQAKTISTILFVCTGNTCRSPLAAGIAQNWLDKHKKGGWLAVSAGVYAQEGMPPSEETIRALADRDISYSGTSKQLTKKMAKEAKAIFCMSESHMVVAKQLARNAKLLDPSGSIADPIGQDQNVYDALADQLEQLIVKRLQKLTA